MPAKFSMLSMAILAAGPCAQAQDEAGPQEGVPGYIISPPPDVLLENAQPIGPGMVRIEVGMHSPAANAYHRQICESSGATDVTDEGPIEFSAASGDAIVCSGPPDHSASAAPIPILTDQQGRVYLPLVTAISLSGPIARASVPEHHAQSQP